MYLVEKSNQEYIQRQEQNINSHKNDIFNRLKNSGDGR